jgi:thioredoxin 1
MASEYLHEFTDDNFEKEVLQSETPVVVDFWAEWCGPCKMLTPIIEDLARGYDGKVKMGKLNVDSSTKYASRYGVTSIPTLLFVKNGSVVDQHVGLLAKGPLENKIKGLL